MHFLTKALIVTTIITLIITSGIKIAEVNVEQTLMSMLHILTGILMIISSGYIYFDKGIRRNWLK
jgi:hypothetical protein